jgi:hypothetical protein
MSIATRSQRREDLKRRKTRNRLNVIKPVAIHRPPPPLAAQAPALSISDVYKAAEKIKRENDVHLRQLAKVRTYVPFFCLLLLFFSAFLGVSRQGKFENTRKVFEYVSEKFTTGNIFSGEDFFPGGFFDFFFLSTFWLRWSSASREGKLKNVIKNVLRVVRLNFSPYRFFLF